MKRWVSLLLTSVLFTGCFAGCGQTRPGEEIGQQLGVSYLTAEQVKSLPVATAQMTKEELRQLCVDYFKMQISFLWHPNMDIEFPMTYREGIKAISQADLHSGLLYQSAGTGNLYRTLEYYDEKTGVFDLQRALAENGGYGEGAALTNIEHDETGAMKYYRYRSLMTIFNQCSVGAWWGLSRVINSANYAWTYDMTVYNGFIPVGCYTYGFEYNGKQYGPSDIKAFGEKEPKYNNPIGYNIKNVIQDWNELNGETAMYACYAQTKPGDVMVNQTHVIMVKEVKLHTNPDGTIDYDKSAITVVEQTEPWGVEADFNGVKYRQQGQDTDYSFASLQKKLYIPFTFIELLDENDPQDKKHIDYYNEYFATKSAVKSQYQIFKFTEEQLLEMSGPGVEKAKVFTTLEEGTDSITYNQFMRMAVGSNYSISDVFVRVKDGEGKEVLKNIFRARSPRVREVPMTEVNSTWKGNMYDGVKAFADGNHTLEITMQLSTGELLTAFSGKLNP